MTEAVSTTPPDLEKNLRLERALRQLTNRIHSSSLDEILLKVRDDIRSLIGADRVTIYVVEEKEGRKEMFSRLLDGDEVKEIRLPVDDSSLAGFAVSRGRFIKVDDAYDREELAAIDPGLRFDDSWDKRTGYRTRAVMVAPIFQGRNVIGAIQVVNKADGGTFTDSDARMLDELASTLAIAFTNQRRIHSRRSRYDYLLLNGIITDEDLDKARAISQREGTNLDTVLLEHFGVSKEDLGKSLSMFYRCPFVAYSEETELPEHLMEKLDIAAMKNRAWVPLADDGTTVKVVTSDPRDVFLRDEIRDALEGRKVEFLVGTRDDIIAFIDDFIRSRTTQTDESLGEILETLDVEAPLEEAASEQEEEETSADENDSAVVRLVNSIIVDAYRRGASDIHLEPYLDGNMTVRYRIDGICTKVAEIPRSLTRAVISRIKIMSNLDIAERRLPQDGKIRFKNFGPLNIELRVATLPTTGGQEDCVLRLLAASEPIPLDKIGMRPENLERFKGMVEQPYGLILVVGPTGSGKTTTLHSALGHINTPERKIWTAEDPVEITQKGLRQVQVIPKIGYTFERAMRAFLRADPDVIMIGEMRDPETAAAAVEASLTGHLVFSTLHTNSAPETITRLLDMGLDPYSFADSLLGVLAQRLIRTLCTHCREEYTPSAEEIDVIAEEYGGRELMEQHGLDLSNVRLFRAGGCNHCNGTGYRGRMGIHELLVCTAGLRQLIYRRASIEEIRRRAMEDGMRLLVQDGIAKALEGLTDMKEVRRVCMRQGA